MIPLIGRLNYKAQKEIYIFNQPPEFADELRKIEQVASVRFELTEATEIEFALIFVQSKKEIEEILLALTGKLKGDVVLWYAFPKKTSKRYRVEINRDKGWDSLAEANLICVRAVAIDADWSALRFRRVEYIKSMTRRFNPA
jgi:hypothetical protein